jgi:enolase-phosphatase E1
LQFPYALKALPDVLASKWEDDEFKLYRDAFPEDFRDSPEALQAHVEDLTQRDVKIAYLKNLQGYLWKTGYETRAYSTPLFPDVAPKLKQWKEEGIDLAIYSSGSVFAQRLLFGHVQASGPVTGQKRGRNEPEDGHHDSTVEPPAKRTATSDDTVAEAAAGLKPTVTEDDKEGAAKTIGSEDTDSKDTPTEDLQHLVDGWFDTTNAGSKVEASSYKTIAGKFNVSRSTSTSVPE